MLLPSRLPGLLHVCLYWLLLGFSSLFHAADILLKARGPLTSIPLVPIAHGRSQN
jgi:hypothetical protein